jgi:hypothetical protein
MGTLGATAPEATAVAVNSAALSLALKVFAQI